MVLYILVYSVEVREYFTVFYKVLRKIPESLLCLH